MHVNNFFVCGPKFMVFFSSNVGGVVVDQLLFRIFDLWIRFGHIRDQSRKLSEIAPNFGRFFALLNFRGQPIQKLYSRYHPWLATRRVDKNL